jgi:hypothetical protein
MSIFFTKTENRKAKEVLSGVRSVGRGEYKERV